MPLVSRRTGAGVCLASIVILAGACSGDSTDGASGSSIGSTATTAPAGTSVAGDSVATTIGSSASSDKPSVSSLPSVPVTELGITDLRDGTGPAAAEGDTVVVDYVGVRSEDGAEFDNSYDLGQAFAVGPLGTASVIDGWNQGLVGVKAGGMRQLDIPNALAYGDQAQGDVIQAGDDLTFIVEIRAVIPATTADQEPDVTVASSSGSTELVTTELVEGTGEEVVAGTHAVVNYLAFNGADGTQLDSSWQTGSPLTFTVGAGEVLAGIEQGVLGMKVGGRRQVVIPAELAFGSEGSSDLGLAADADLIMVFELVATY